MITARLTKREFKICEAVYLGLDYYYMDGPRDRRMLTLRDYDEAKSLLTTLPDGWYREHYDWMVQKY